MTLSPYSFEGQRSNRCWPGPWGLGAALTFVLTGVWRGCGRSGPRPDLRVCRQRQGQGEAGRSLSKIAFVVVWFELSDTRNTGSWDRVSGKKTSRTSRNASGTWGLRPPQSRVTLGGGGRSCCGGSPAPGNEWPLRLLSGTRQDRSGQREGALLRGEQREGHVSTSSSDKIRNTYCELRF